MAFSKPIPPREDLVDLLVKTKARWDSMTPEQRALNREIQRLSYVKGEMLMGDDEFEARYRDALQNGTPLPEHHPSTLKFVAKLDDEITDLRKRLAVLDHVPSGDYDGTKPEDQG